MSLPRRFWPLVLLAAHSPGITAETGTPLPDAGFPYFVSNCFNCHGTEGRSSGGVPALAGQAEGQIYQALMAFKQGQRPATIMHQLSRGYTDEELATLARYFARREAP